MLYPKDFKPWEHAGEYPAPEYASEREVRDFCLQHAAEITARIPDEDGVYQDHRLSDLNEFQREMFIRDSIARLPGKLPHKVTYGVC